MCVFLRGYVETTRDASTQGEFEEEDGFLLGG